MFQTSSSVYNNFKSIFVPKLTIMPPCVFTLSDLNNIFYTFFFLLGFMMAKS
jgi:hypothetical protein